MDFAKLPEIVEVQAEVNELKKKIEYSGQMSDAFDCDMMIFQYAEDLLGISEYLIGYAKGVGTANGR